MYGMVNSSVLAFVQRILVLLLSMEESHQGRCVLPPLICSQFLPEPARSRTKPKEDVRDDTSSVLGLVYDGSNARFIAKGDDAT